MLNKEAMTSAKMPEDLPRKPPHRSRRSRVSWARYSAAERLAIRLAGESRRKDEFLALLAHELRSPLAPIRLSAQSLIRQRGGDPAVKRAADVIEHQVVHLTRLVEDVLDLSRFTWGKVALRRETVYLHDAVELAVQMVEPLVREKGHQLSTVMPGERLWIFGDLSRLTQALHNLLDNSAKYTPPGGEIQLHLSCLSGAAVILVRDNGIGIAPELRDRLFEPFSRGSSDEAGRAGGLGLGLCLVKRLLEAQGGTVSVHSDGPGQGTLFEVRLPLPESDAALA